MVPSRGPRGGPAGALSPQGRPKPRPKARPGALVGPVEEPRVSRILAPRPLQGPLRVRPSPRAQARNSFGLPQGLPLRRAAGLFWELAGISAGWVLRAPKCPPWSTSRGPSRGPRGLLFEGPRRSAPSALLRDSLGRPLGRPWGLVPGSLRELSGIPRNTKFRLCSCPTPGRSGNPACHAALPGRRRRSRARRCD